MSTRTAVFSGNWYPREADACEKEIEHYLAREIDAPVRGNGWTTGIVPHAGWVYSGRLACRVIDLLKGTAPVDLAVVFGMHLHPRSPNYLMAHGAWETPFGELPVAEDLAEHLMNGFDFKVETPRRFIEDNTVEVQLPFIKYLLNPSCFLALGVPPAPQSIDIGKAVGQWAIDHNKRIRIIGSTDLTHYGPNYGFCPQGSGRKAMEWVRDKNDRYMIDAILDMDPERIIREGLTRQNACCAGAAASAVAAARQMGAVRAHEVAYASSYDRSPGDSFVGYTGVVMGPGS